MRERLFATTAALLFGCGGARGAGSLARPDLLPQPTSSSGQGHGTAAPPECDNVRPPARSTLVAHYYATGVQRYRWSDTAWTFVAPEAVLFSDAAGTHRAGTHYAGPTWESISGGKIVGTVAQRCTPNAPAIPWLSLTATPGDGSGIFTGVTFIERTHTTGGLAPSARGNLTGQEVRVPYSAEYFFYRVE